MILYTADLNCALYSGMCTCIDALVSKGNLGHNGLPFKTAGPQVVK